MDPIYYFLKHSLILHLSLAVIACALGLAAGWWLWARFQNQCEDLSSELAQHKDRATKLTRERDDITRSKDELQLGLATAKTDTEKFKTQLAASRDDITQQTSTLSSLMQDKQSLQQRVTTLEQAQNETKDQMAASRTQAATLSDDKVKLEARVKELQSELAKLKTQSSAREKDLSLQIEAGQQAATLVRQEVEQLRSEQESLIQKNGVASASMEAMAAELREMQSRFASVRDNSEKQTEDREGLQSQLTRLATELSQSDEHLSRSQQKLEHLEQEHRKTLHELEAARSGPAATPAPAMPPDWEAQQTRYEEEIVRLRERLATATASPRAATPAPSRPSASAASQAPSATAAPLLFDLPEN